MTHRVVGIGETVYDIIFKNNQPVSATPGGSTFNAMISLGRTGTPCAMVTETGDDHIGEMTCRFMEDNGVDTIYVNRRKGIKSHISLAFLDENDDAHYQFYKDHASDEASTVLPDITSDDVVLFGSFYAINPVIRPTVKRLIETAHKNGATIYYDINFRASHIADIPYIMEALNENIAMSSVVRGSLEDFGYLYGTTDVDEIYNKYIRPFCPYFICTDGGKPVQLRTPELSVSFPARQLKTVSTIGAGDNFNAGFIYSLINNITNKASNDGIAPLNELTEADWKTVITTAQSFSAEVCQSVDNYISKAFVNNHLRTTL